MGAAAVIQRQREDRARKSVDADSGLNGARSPNEAGAPIGALIGPVSCVSCVSWRCWVIATETHETVSLESGMRYHTGPLCLDSRSELAILGAEDRV